MNMAATETNPEDDDGSVIGQGDGNAGDHFWGPRDNQGQGPGEGKADDDDQSQDGDEPSIGPDGHKPKDPSEMVLPLEEYGKMLIGKLGLKNIRRTDSANVKIESEKDSTRLGDDIDLQIEQMMGDILVKGSAKLGRKRLPVTAHDFNEVFRAGLKQIVPDDYRVKDRSPTPIPEHKAVVVFVMDMTGSMMGLPVQLEREIVYSTIAILRAVYTQVDFRFVGYDDEAHEFPEKTVFQTFLGGGNTDSTGYIKAAEILKEYPKEQWNRYVIGMGDGGSSDTPATIKAMEELYPTLQYMGFAHVVGSWYAGEPSFVAAIENLSKKYPWFGFAHVTSDRSTIVTALKEFFGEKKK